MNFDDLINKEANEGDEGISEDNPESGATYLQRHLLDIQNYLNDEIKTRKSISSFLGLLLAQSANYTFSLILISSGAEFFSSTIIGLIIGLMPPIADLSHINQKSAKPVERFLPVAVKAAIALFTSGIIFTQVTLPHLGSRAEVERVYEDIQTIERGSPDQSFVDNLTASPITPIAAVVLLFVGMKMALPKD